MSAAITKQPVDIQSFESKSAEELLRWALTTFGQRVALASSMSAEDNVVFDLMWKINPKARLFTLDTGRLNQETYDVMDALRKKYNVSLEVMFPDATAVEQMVRTKGLNLFYESIENRKLCCGIRKVEPLNRALKTCDAWITGLRREQAVTRTALTKVEIDTAHGGIIKINPIADWTSEQVWDYIKQHQVPYNKLHDQGYPSIGCEPCTRAVKPGEDPRAGRWWWERPEQKECGLHVKEHK
ncbi:MAG: phosphoadenylyl-sulfate reductase [Candidatus Omnitrophica bacterium]|nr:phosphoadenylyl-sulfate reductase [Candidatus Omnitrophota bacterium]